MPNTTHVSAGVSDSWRCCSKGTSCGAGVSLRRLKGAQAVGTPEKEEDSQKVTTAGEMGKRRPRQRLQKGPLCSNLRRPAQAVLQYHCAHHVTHAAVSFMATKALVSEHGGHLALKHGAAGLPCDTRTQSRRHAEHVAPHGQPWQSPWAVTVCPAHPSGVGERTFGSAAAAGHEARNPLHPRPSAAARLRRRAFGALEGAAP